MHKNINKVLNENPILEILFSGIGTSILFAIFEYVVDLNIPKYIYLILALLMCVVVLFINNYKLKRGTLNCRKESSEALVEFGYYMRYDFMDFLKSAQNNVFVIGITNNGALSPVEKFIDILDKGIVINILVESDENLLEIMCDFYYGANAGKTRLEHNKTQVKGVVSSFSVLPKYNTYLKNGQINIRKLKTIISTSYLAVDITKNYEEICDDGKIQATFYQYKADTTNSPCTILDKYNSNSVYFGIGKSILAMWEDSEKIDLPNIN